MAEAPLSHEGFISHADSEQPPIRRDLESAKTTVFKDLLEFLDAVELEARSATPVLIQEWFEGRYEVERFLGAGRTCAAFLAHDTQLQRRIALKIWRDMGHAGGGDLVTSDMLLKEGRHLARIDHPRVVGIFGSGVETKTGRPWLALEYLGERTLRTALVGAREALLDIQRVIEVGIQVAGIIDYLHNHPRLWQLDIKPENLALLDDDTLKLMDLGSCLDERPIPRVRLGTPGYIAPELLIGEDPTPQSDTFSFGVLLIELLSGMNLVRDIQLQLANDVRVRPAESSRSLSRLTSRYRARASDAHAKTERVCSHASISVQLEGRAVPSDLPRLVADMCLPLPQDRPSALEVSRRLRSLTDAAGKSLLPRIFISHSRHDRERFALRIKALLESRGFDTWLDDTDLRLGEPVWENIAKTIEECDYVLVVLSRRSLVSSGATEELRLAHIGNLSRVKVLPIRIDAISIDAIPPVLKSRHIMDFVGWENDADMLEKLVSRLVSDILALSDHNAIS